MSASQAFETPHGTVVLDGDVGTRLLALLRGGTRVPLAAECAPNQFVLEKPMLSGGAVHDIATVEVVDNMLVINGTIVGLEIH